MDGYFITRCLIAAWLVCMLTLASAQPVPATGYTVLPDAVPEGRLPDWVTPRRYRIDLTLVPERPRFSGHVEIDAHLNRATDHFFMDGLGLAMHRVEVCSGAHCRTARFTQASPLGVARFDLPQRMSPGNIRLVFDYDAAFSDSSVGIFHLREDGRWYAWSNFEPLDARRAFPGFDQPGYKTPFEISVATLPGLLVISNSPQTSSTRDGALVRHRFAPTKPLPAYLAAFYVGPFAYVSGSLPASRERPEPLPIRVAGPAAYSAQMPYVLDNSEAILGLLEDYFGEPFPFPKLDQVGTPLLNGGMENAGADLYGAQTLFVDGRSAPAEQGYFGMLVAHELAHQWFGDLVTPLWWDDLWLNESFADWMGYRIASAWRPNLAFGTQAVAGALHAMDIDALGVGRAIHQPIARNRDIAGSFDDITYAKGGQVIAMIAAYLGDTTFRDAVRKYLNGRRYGNASSNDFFEALADSAHDPRVAMAMRSFVDQPGVPQIDLKHENGHIRISQKPYAALGTTPANRHWIIPFCWRVLPSGKRQCVLLDRPSMTLPVSAEALVFPNAGGTGYYRFGMDDAAWGRLIAQAGILQPAEALTLVDSAWAAFGAGQLSFKRLLDLTTAMAVQSYGPAAVASANKLLDLERSGRADDRTCRAIDTFIGNVYRPLLAKLGFNPAMSPHTDEAAAIRQRRNDIAMLLAKASDDRTVQALDEAAKQYLLGDTRALAPNFVGVGLRVYVQHHSVEDAKTLWLRALDSEEEAFRHAALAAVADSGNSSTARWLLSQWEDKRLRPTERVSIVLGLLGQPATRQLGEDATLEHFDQLEDRTGHYGVVLLSGPGSVCSTAEAKTFGQAMLTLARKHSLGALEIERGIALGRQCDALWRSNGMDINSVRNR